MNDREKQKAEEFISVGFIPYEVKKEEHPYNDIGKNVPVAEYLYEN